MDLKPGSRWKSAVCDTQVIIVRAPKETVTLECGGQPMIAPAAAKPAGLTLSSEHASGTHAGKRFADDETGLEALCTKAGAGSLSIDGRAIGAREAKKLPSSD